MKVSLLIISFLYLTHAIAEIHYDFTDTMDYSLEMKQLPNTRMEVAVHKYEANITNDKLFISIHGFLDNCGYLKDIHSVLFTQGYDVHCLDLPGHGLSDGEDGEISSFIEYAYMLQTINFEELRKKYKEISFIAHSTGTISYLEAMRQNFKVDFDKVILLAPLVRSNHWKWSMLAHSILGDFIENFPRRKSKQERFLEIKATDKRYIDHTPSSWVQSLKNWDRERRKSPPQTFTKTIDIIFGKQDVIIDRVYSTKIYREFFPNANIHVLTESTHHIDLDDPQISKSFYRRLTSILRN